MKSRLYTPQEHKLFGSSVLGRKYEINPYTPLTVIDGEMTAEECNEERRRLGYIEGVLACKWGTNYGLGTMTLEELDSMGNTIKDPMLVKVDKRTKLKRELNDSLIPFARGNPITAIEND